MLRFVDVEQHYPETVSPELRKQQFQEIYREFTLDGLRGQASRCSQCGVPFCQQHCPLQNNIPDWLKLAAEDRLEEAYQLSSATNNFPEICGRICPQDKLCEGNCVVEKGFGAVTIGSVEKFLTDQAWEKGWVKPLRPRQERDGSIAIIGAGPAGLAAAEQLRRYGWRVVVVDRYDRAGGLMIYGIPSFKLDKAVVERRTNWLAEGGIRFMLEQDVGRTTSLDELLQQHDAVLVATGVYRARDLALPGMDAAGIVPALPYLTASNRSQLEAGFAIPPHLNARGRQVVVLGGGDTAMDAVRTAVRQGAASVTCLYRRDRANMPGSAREVKHAEEEGVQFRWLMAPKAFLSKDGQVSGVVAGEMRLGAPDLSGRQAVIALEGSKLTVPADMVIHALGFEPEDMPVMFDTPALATHADGRIRLREGGFETSIPRVYAAGDIVRGASLVVWAIRDGRDAARHIHQELSQQGARHAA